MDSSELGEYITANNGISKPWLLVQMRLLKLQEIKDTLPETEYAERLADIYQDMMNLGEWWIGQEDEVFGDR
ncbi:hypothetical protein Pse7367_3912 (plasmid) [Thalassoporum mexicanum PCC 7367]|uniref:hypothetical protein n=1 Tax=Thalassoporum mexicanum TaxID=3457544 RepID=UPI00029F8E59|nr:hypothetical protein [Pseudanabaena sp. PCC 7367]AFY72129.1 hypothetical protein Pse7367_3912 [Pseudanabaena sp. PCC 7367]